MKYDAYFSFTYFFPNKRLFSLFRITNAFPPHCMIFTCPYFHWKEKVIISHCFPHPSSMSQLKKQLFEKILIILITYFSFSNTTSSTRIFCSLTLMGAGVDELRVPSAPCYWSLRTPSVVDYQKNLNKNTSLERFGFH